MKAYKGFEENAYYKYAKSQEASINVLNWIATVLKNYLKKNSPTESEVEHIIDYLMSEKAPTRISRMSYKSANEAAEKWNRSLQKKGAHIVETKKDTETVHAFPDGSRIAKLLTKKAYEREGFLMRHCLGGYDPKKSEVYSYRDSYNNPHATIEIQRKDNVIQQVKGKGNGAIHPKYISFIMTFLEIVGIKVRPNEMRNLGYHHVPQNCLDLIYEIEGGKEKLTLIGGEHYVFETN